jgi:hypothetical protein
LHRICSYANHYTCANYANLHLHHIFPIRWLTSESRPFCIYTPASPHHRFANSPPRTAPPADLRKPPCLCRSPQSIEQQLQRLAAATTENAARTSPRATSLCPCSTSRTSPRSAYRWSRICSARRRLARYALAGPPPGGAPARPDGAASPPGRVTAMESDVMEHRMENALIIQVHVTLKYCLDCLLLSLF